MGRRAAEKPTNTKHLETGAQVTLIPKVSENFIILRFVIRQSAVRLAVPLHQ